MRHATALPPQLLTVRSSLPASSDSPWGKANTQKLSRTPLALWHSKLRRTWPSVYICDLRQRNRLNSSGTSYTPRNRLNSLRATERYTALLIASQCVLRVVYELLLLTLEFDLDRRPIREIVTRLIHCTYATSHLIRSCGAFRGVTISLPVRRK